MWVALEVASAVRANALEEPVEELERDPDGIVVAFGPFELITVRVELAAPCRGDDQQSKKKRLSWSRQAYVRSMLTQAVTRALSRKQAQCSPAPSSFGRA